jgi:hypothetical protein
MTRAFLAADGVMTAAVSVGQRPAGRCAHVQVELARLARGRALNADLLDHGETRIQATRLVVLTMARR